MPTRRLIKLAAHHLFTKCIKLLYAHKLTSIRLCTIREKRCVWQGFSCYVAHASVQSGWIPQFAVLKDLRRACQVRTILRSMYGVGYVRIRIRNILHRCSQRIRLGTPPPPPHALSRRGAGDLPQQCNRGTASPSLQPPLSSFFPSPLPSPLATITSPM